MTRDEIQKVVFSVLSQIAPETDPATLAPDDNLRKTLDIDSFDALNFFIRIDETLGVSVPEADYGKLNSLGQIVEYLADRVK
ncbi:MAG TPA: phosphopantetheine-binding protein [Desulforhopalus sp.]|jgi:acyl carrier protein|nr:phosphopantetheine-binding protein [Desulforhopalus sp.]